MQTNIPIKTKTQEKKKQQKKKEKKKTKISLNRLCDQPKHKAVSYNEVLLDIINQSEKHIKCVEEYIDKYSILDPNLICEIPCLDEVIGFAWLC